MGPEEQIAQYLRGKGVQHAIIKDMLDRFAHDLAEVVRKEADERYGPDSRYGAGMLTAADLIDPEVA